MRNLLKEKEFACVLAENLGNDPIEKLCSKSRFMAGGNSHLDVPSFNHSQQTLLLREL